MKQIIKIKPPKGYRWVQVGERQRIRDKRPALIYYRSRFCIYWEQAFSYIGGTHPCTRKNAYIRKIIK